MKTTTWSIVRYCLLLFVSCVNHTQVFSQIPDIPCAPSPVPWVYKSFEYQPLPLEIIGELNYWERIVNGRKEIIFDENSVVGYIFSKSTTLDLLKMMVIKSSENCPFQGIKEVAVLYKTNCYVTLQCEVEVENNWTLDCVDTDYTGSGCQRYIRNNKSYVRYTRNQSCGVKCCEKVFQLECKGELYQYSKPIATIVGVYSNTYPNSICITDGNNYIDCNGQPIPCNEGQCE